MAPVTVGEDWVHVIPRNESVPRDSSPIESMTDRVTRIPIDLSELKVVYPVSSSPTTHKRLQAFYAAELDNLENVAFPSLSHDEQVDYILLKNWLWHEQKSLEHAVARDKTYAEYVEPFAAPIRDWIEKRMRVEQLDPQQVAESFDCILRNIRSCTLLVERKAKEYSPASAYRAAKTVKELRKLLQETNAFYIGYDPLWDWWVKAPYAELDAALLELPELYMEKIAGIKHGDTETIVGEPIGRDALLTELKSEMISYTPEELIRIAEKEYKWCESEMIRASKELGFGNDWKAALEHVKTLYEPPGSQPVFVKSLIDEGIAYVKKHDLVTVPDLAEELFRMTMISPARQKVSPFFLYGGGGANGGNMLVSYPTPEMAHADKLMSMRGNNRHFSRAVAFHEMIPGHHLQLFTASRVKKHRMLFVTPFYIEGWALYWELVLWNRGDFFKSPEDRIGSMFWRMHRCARIVFSLRFHLGLMTPQECVDLLVNWVGHERSTAEGEVRRSCGEDYSPLYQCGYLLGALQLWKLREEVLGSNKNSQESHAHMTEKAFHDRILSCNMMPIAMVRNIVLERDLTEDWKSTWKFYDNV